jgi:dihydroflavonol-4-reductase
VFHAQKNDHLRSLMTKHDSIVLVTGATGMVGAGLCLDLLKRGRRVRGLRRKGSKEDILKRTFEGHEQLLSAIEWISGDITEVLSVRDAVDGVQEVYHTAAIVSFDPRQKNQIESVNVTGTTNVVNMALECGVQRLCHISSVASIGRSVTDAMIHEDIPWSESTYNTWYAITKYAAEREVWRGIEEGLNAFVVNPSIILGPGNRESGSGLLFRAVHEGLRFYPQGSTGFVDVRDVTVMCMALMDQNTTGERYILSSGNVTYRLLFSWMASAMQLASPNIPVSPAMAGLAWRAERLRSLLTGSYPKVTRETAHTSSRCWNYSNDKVRARTGLDFIPVEESCRYWAEEFLRTIGG